jgi:hypothetical protein
MILGNAVATLFGPSFKLVLCFESFANSKRYLMLAMNVLHGVVDKQGTTYEYL